MEVLIIIPYQNIYPPLNGGMKRCFHVLNQLSLYHQVTALTFQEPSKFESAAVIYPGIRTVKFFSPTRNKVLWGSNMFISRLINAVRFRWYIRRIKGPTDSNFIMYYGILRSLLDKEKYDCIVLENLATINAIPVIRRMQRKVKIIYDAHNFDTELASGKHLKSIAQREAALYKDVEEIWTCSKRDKDAFEAANKFRINCRIVPNGIELGQLHNKGIFLDNPLNILFVGSLDYLPNREGLIWFIDNCWEQFLKKIPGLTMSIIGSGAMDEHTKNKIDKSGILSYGKVEAVEPYYNKAGIVIVPILSGSGTRLKVLEAMSFGVPVLSTAKGAEGIDYVEDRDIVIADLPELFIKKAISLLTNKDKRIRVSGAGRKLVQNYYDWEKIGKQLFKSLNTY